MSADLVPVPVPGTDRQIMATLVNGQPMVSLRHCCEAIGIDPESQRRKLRSRSWAVAVQETATGSDGKFYAMTMIDRRTMTMWLGGVDENRVSAEARPVLIAFQAEAADALDAYFNGRAGAAQAMSQLDVLRAAIDQIEAAQRDAAEAKALAAKTDARLDAMEGRHDWYSALGYARLHGVGNTSTQFLNRVGRQASSIAKRHSITPVKVPHQLFGEVNSYLAWIWEIAFFGNEAS